MSVFIRSRPISTATPSIEVWGGLAVGRHRFRLEVISKSGQRSVPSEAIVDVRGGVARDDLLDVDHLLGR